MAAIRNDRGFEGVMADLGAISEARAWALEAWGSEGDGRDLSGAGTEMGGIRRQPNAVARTWHKESFAVGGGLRFTVAPTHRGVMEEIVYTTPEAIIIAAEEGDIERVVCALGSDPMVAAPVPTTTVTVEVVRQAA